ncbi:MAG: ABC transporter ATP-binding protein [Desulfobacterota bacterium]|jgi:peptide/nickel transport system ATP-binding protein/oligopeptide transport system ATP-binding protein|nr:ABC transporter ATP-binding protein [Thermodesulfobacteriota bacterium]
MSQRPDDILLEVRDLHTSFKTDEGLILAVAGVDFVMRQGETLGLVGESGSGKTVAALSIMRLIPEPPGRIFKGQILFEGRDLLRLSEREMRKVRGNRISMIFQEPMTCLNPVVRVGDQIGEAVRLHQGLSTAEARSVAVQMLRKVGIPDPDRRAKEFPHQLSGGMRQRVMIGMALACHPRLIIADEPTTALDVTIQAQILELMNDLKEDFQTAVLLITHDLGVIAETAQWVAVMYAGRIVEYADVKTLFSDPSHPYTIGLLESMPSLDGDIPEDRTLRTIPGMVPSLLDLKPGCTFQDRCPTVFDRCRQEEPLLFRTRHGRLSRCWLHER